MNNTTTQVPDLHDSTLFQSFQNLMKHRIRDILLVSSRYDSYIFEEDGRLYEQIRNEYQELSISHAPELTRVSSGREALRLAREERRFDLVITTMHIEDMHPLEFAREARKTGVAIPMVLLAFDNREVSDLIAKHDTSDFDRIFIWQGDYRLIIAIVKHLEDRMNVEHDTAEFGVQSIILIEDNIRFYSSFLPFIYSEILKQSRELITEGVNLLHRNIRMKARPKILLCTDYDEAWKYFESYGDHVLGIISDVDFQQNGKQNGEAGVEFARAVRKKKPDVPILLQSHLEDNERKAASLGVAFVLKDSPLLLHEVQRFMNLNFSFGDFVFRTPDGREVGRAHDLKSLEEQLLVVPAESLLYHGERNDFSNWLKARTEFWLAYQLRPRKISDYPSTNELRAALISALHSYRLSQRRGIIIDYARESFDPSSSFARIGGGSLGGKARGLGFFNRLLNTMNIRDKFGGVEIFIPSGVVIGTDVFDQFLDENNLRSVALGETDDRTLTKRFLEAGYFPQQIRNQLETFLDLVRDPLAVRSSSLLEDSQYQPFAGVYETYMLPNNNPSDLVRLEELLDAVRRVYASTFYQRTKNYIRMTPYRLEEEKMAVIVQKMVGARHGDRFYPEISGVAKSYNFYPAPSQLSADGITSVALGLGKMVVDGGTTVRFCPKYPLHLQQLSSIADTLANNQHEFFALEMSARFDSKSETYDVLTRNYPLSVAEGDGTLSVVGSTYSPENDAVYDGIARPGMRLVTFAPVLKNRLLPIAEIIDLMLTLGSGGMGSPVEMEFAVNMSVPPGAPKQFGILQVRPLVVSREFGELSLEKIRPEDTICRSGQVLGNGLLGNLCDLVVVDNRRFDRAKTVEVAHEVGELNARLVAENRPYILIGLGRWGTMDPWLGIPVAWDQISGARAIVETGFRDFIVTPSQGSHFFQNLTSFMVGYFTVNPDEGQGMIDWEWIHRQAPLIEKEYTRLLRFDRPMVVKMNGHEHSGVIMKPSEG
ncbi:MAG TPA: PEP/pyruvate-binding domain-containing protein [Bacteroidota bacterium]|nr:PEP/pyruvate-binding domain-containing protein [Bacteroidota bacterium]